MSTPLDVGIIVPQVAMPVDDVLARAAACERLGLASIWFYDHLGAPGLPDKPSLEAWTLATTVLARTSTLRAGHLVLCNSLRHPALLASMVATLDVVSGGRLEVGLGSGSWEPEHRAAGLPWPSLADRSAQLAESLEVLTRLWTGEEVRFDGAWYSIAGLRCLPRPVQRPHPPIVVGGAHPVHTLPVVARYADVWNVPTYALGRLDAAVEDLRRACDAVGRDPATITLSVQGVLGLAEDESGLAEVRAVATRRFGSPAYGLEAGGLVGTPGMVADRLAALREAGVQRVMLFTHDRAEPATLELLATQVLAKL